MSTASETKQSIMMERIRLFSDWLIDEVYERHIGAYTLPDLAKSNNAVTRESAEIACRHFNLRVVR